MTTTAALPTSPASAELTAARARWDAAEPAPGIADLILAAPCATLVGGLVVKSHGWDAADGDRADAAGPAGSPEWHAALGQPRHAELTADGLYASPTTWCRCYPDPTPGAWIAYETWTRAGRVAHGYICRTCRNLLQAG
jgi:hypothetical protein